MVLDQGYAYQSGGSVYFDVNKFERASARSATSTATRCWSWPPSVAATPTRIKRDPSSAAGSRSAPDEPSRESSRGCDAGLAHRVLGAGHARVYSTIDLHGGGTDLIFPHHGVAEAAQSEAATASSSSVTGCTRPWSACGESMSKSLGNLVFISDLLKTCILAPSAWPSSSTTTAIRGSGTTSRRPGRPSGQRLVGGPRRGRRPDRRRHGPGTTTTWTRPAAVPAI